MRLFRELATVFAMTRRPFLALVLAAPLSCTGGGYGPWHGDTVTPSFTLQQDNISTTFEGHVWPETSFIFGPEDGFNLTTANARLTINGAEVWSYAPVFVELYDGAREDIGSEETLIAAWEVPFPERLGGDILYEESRAISRKPVWLKIDFPDFSGQCVFQVLGHH